MEKSIEYSGPRYQSHESEGNTIRVNLTHADGLRTKNGKRVVGFSVAGKDRVFYPVEGVIDGASVVLKSESVVSPVAIRYAWAANPIINLYNEADLPAVSFRTDNWVSKNSENE